MAPGFVSDAGNLAERCFLRVNTALDVVPFYPAQVVAGALQRGERVCRNDDCEPGIAEAQCERVVGAFAVALALDVGVDGFRVSEKRERLVREMGSEIEQKAALRGIILPGHAGRGGWAPAVHGGLEINETSEGAILNELFQREEIAVPAAAVERSEHHVARCGELDQLGNFGRRHAHRLVDNDVLAGFNGPACVFEVAVVGRGDDDEAERRVGEQVIEGAIGGDAGVALGGLVGGALKDGGEFDALHRGDQRGVEDAPTQTKTDQSCTNHCSLQHALAPVHARSGSRARHSRLIIGRDPVNVVNDQDLNWDLLRFQFEAECLTQSSKERWQRRGLFDIGRKLKLDIEASGYSGFVCDGKARRTLQHRDQIRHGPVESFDPARANVDAKSRRLVLCAGFQFWATFGNQQHIAAHQLRLKVSCQMESLLKKTLESWPQLISGKGYAALGLGDNVVEIGV